MNRKLKISSAVSQNNAGTRVDLSRRLLTTAKMAQIFPIYHEDMVPGDKVHVNISNFSRFLPLAVPAYVNLKLRTFTAFVPYHQLADGIDSFFVNQAKYKGFDTKVPVINSNVLMQFLSQGNVSYMVDTADTADFIVGRVNATPYYRRLTNFGCFASRILDNLGYNIKVFPVIGFDVSALPLLSFAHIYNSYLSYAPNQNTSALSRILETIKRNPTQSISVSDLNTIFHSILLCYEDNIFTNAWSQPYESVSNGVTTSPFKVDQIDGEGFSNLLGYSVGSGAQTDVNDGDSISASQVRMLLKFDDIFRRLNYAGSKDIEQIYARFGVKIDDYKTRYPYYINETSQSVQIGDVTSTADTDAAAVGSYAGKAIVSDNVDFTFESHDYGMLITFAWFAPDVQYYRGVDAAILRKDVFDFYTPELDNGFAHALPRIFVDAAGLQMFEPSDTYGYVPLYSEYLFGKDVISGDFLRYAGFDAWHFGRSIDYSMAQSDTTIYFPNIGTPYERIFNIVDTELVNADSCYLTCNIRVDANRPMKNFSGKTMLGDGSLCVEMNGSKMN